MSVTSGSPATQSPNARKDRYGDQIDVVAFPPNLGHTGDEPYMLIKIFETVVGPYESQQSPSDAVIRGGLDIAINAITDPAGAAAAATLNGRSKTDAFFAGLAVSDAGEAILNRTLGAAFNEPTTSNRNYVNESKVAIKQYSSKRNEGRLKAAIGLFMPEGLQTNYNQNFESVSMTQALGTFGFISQAYGSKTIKDAPNPYLIEGVSKFLSQTTGMNESAQKILTYGATGMAINPQIELLYTSPNLREFTLEYKFYPKSADEAKILFGNPNIPAGGDEFNTIARLGIIGALKRFSAPRVPTTDPKSDPTGKNATEIAYGGRYFIPPAQFQLEFYNNQANLNTNFFKTKNCVLSGIALDFTPSGFATHDDGVPVEIRMTLTFKETVMLNQSDIDDGY